MNVTEESNSGAEETAIASEQNVSDNDEVIATDEEVVDEEETTVTDKTVDTAKEASEKEETVVTTKEGSDKEETSDSKENTTEKEEKIEISNVKNNDESNTEQKENSVKSSITLNAMLATEPELLRGSSSTTVFNEDDQYISITKTFSGITREQIPADFSINIGSFELKCSNTNQYFKSVSSDGLTWNWRIEGVSGGTYNFTENNETINGYNVTTSPNKDTIVGVRSSSIGINILEEDTTCNHKDWAVANNFVFAGSLTGKLGKRTVVITQKALSSAQREALEDSIRKNASSNVFNKEHFYFFSVEKQGNEFFIGDSKVIYNGTACVFDTTSMWQHVLRGTLTEDPGQSADIVISNEYKSNKTQITVEKQWVNRERTSAAPDGASVEFTLFANGNATEKKVILDGKVDENGEDTPWKATFSNLEKFDESENEIRYTVAETNGYTGYTASTTAPVSDGGKIINTFYKAEGKAQIEVSKELAGRKLEANQFSFVLKDEAGKEIETVKNDAEGKVTFSEISYNEADAGKTYTYQITEVNGGAKGYAYDPMTVKVTVTVKVTDNGDGTLKADVSYSEDTIFNNVFETININVIKEWNDQNNKFSYRPDSIMVRLFANGVEIKNAILNKVNEWKYIFENLDKYSDGEEIEYTVAEDKIFGYTASITGDVENGFVITNNLDAFGGGDPNDFTIGTQQQAASSISVGTENPINIVNPSTRSQDHFVVCILLSFASVCTMIIATKKYKEKSKNQK